MGKGKPLSTYRLQMNHQFTFSHLLELIDYFEALGITHLYLSPILQAHSHSPHGYDVIDYNAINTEIGTEEELEKIARELQQRNMGLILDCVPNHMYICDDGNAWWHNVLENGRSSPYADYFDIAWKNSHTCSDNKILLPFLNQQYGEALENQLIQLTLKEGAFYITLWETLLPTDPCTWISILERDDLKSDLLSHWKEDSQPYLEFTSITTALKHLPKTTDLNAEEVSERQREKEVVKSRLASLLKAYPPFLEVLSDKLKEINGRKGKPESFDALEAFINAQPYRLCYWRVASDEINYRRFFDVSNLAGIKTEKKEVFDAIHVKVLEFVERGWVDGLRIDHIDGLIDPQSYLKTLQHECKARGSVSDHPIYIAAEKILTGKEKLRPSWPLAGTVGYDFLNQLNGLYIDMKSKQPLLALYRAFTGITENIKDIIYESKRLILFVSMSSEHHTLSHFLYKIAKQHRSTRDFTEETLRSALRDVIASFPVYRTYLRPEDKTINDEDRKSILKAIGQAQRRNPALSNSIFDFIRSVLLLEYPSGLADSHKEERWNFILRVQQLTGPITAKGLEDTACYRFYPLASLNEVGSDLTTYGISPEEFHALNKERQHQWPHTLLATSTHDTKRSEDIRARLNVLTEMTQPWRTTLEEWVGLNNKHKTAIDDELFPDNNVEYLLYQTLIGCWPLYPMDPSSHLQYMKRIDEYMLKAVREAKTHTSWINPSEAYEQALSQFIQNILNPDKINNPFLPQLITFVKKFQIAGMYNSLSQTCIKMLSPGIPDIYQGNESWAFNLVDPDNRQPVDFTSLRYMLSSLQKRKGDPTLADELSTHPEDGLLKLFITSELLHLRRSLPELFLEGDYLPLEINGKEAHRCLAFLRRKDNIYVIVVATRFFSDLITAEPPFLSSSLWDDTVLSLPHDLPQSFQHLFLQKDVVVEDNTLKLSLLLDRLPAAALLHRG